MDSCKDVDNLKTPYNEAMVLPKNDATLEKLLNLFYWRAYSQLLKYKNNWKYVR